MRSRRLPDVALRLGGLRHSNAAFRSQRFNRIAQQHERGIAPPLSHSSTRDSSASRTGRGIDDDPNAREYKEGIRGEETVGDGVCRIELANDGVQAGGRRWRSGQAGGLVLP